MIEVYSRFIAYFVINIFIYSLLVHDLSHEHNRESDKESTSALSSLTTIGFTIFAIIATVKNAINGTITELYFSIALLAQSITELIMICIIKKENR